MDFNYQIAIDDQPVDFEAVQIDLVAAGLSVETIGQDGLSATSPGSLSTKDHPLKAANKVTIKKNGSSLQLHANINSVRNMMLICILLPPLCLIYMLYSSHGGLKLIAVFLFMPLLAIYVRMRTTQALVKLLQKALKNTSR